MSAGIRFDAFAVLAWLQRHAGASAQLCLDSRQVRAGDVFFACGGRQADGCAHIAQAVQAGAVAVVAQVRSEEEAARLQSQHVDGGRFPLLAVQDLRALLGDIAHEWYGRPSQTLTVVAVTGTNGKTSTVQWLAAALGAEQVPCGTVGTLGVTLPDGANLGGVLTTPDVLTMHRSLAAMRDAGAAVAAIEASSIGIEQGRLDGVRIAWAGFTNLTHDHLDYHQTLASYRDAKFALFARSGLLGAVVNLDDPAGVELFDSLPADQRLGYTCQADPRACVQATDLRVAAHGQVFSLMLPDGVAQLVTPMPGVHNVSNLLLVAGVLHRMGWPLQRVVRALASLQPVPGRLQVVPAPSVDGAVGAPLVVVDYAHTPDALERALLALRQTAQASAGRLVCVFGCGGDRDTAKRPIMGRIAASLADQVIVTSDNPRSEAPQAIIEQIIDGISPRPAVVIERAQAILQAVLDAAPGDVVLLAGKGHETWQEAGGQRKPFDDREWAAMALAWRLAQGVSTDSRRLQPGQLFVALAGDAFDGHRYLSQVAQAGALGAVVTERDPQVALPQFCVGDTREALAHMGAAWRRRRSIPVIAVTGSNGKTTTKEMIAAILREWLGDDAVLATQGNLNNEIGVPLTVLRLAHHHRAAVVELGMNHPGEIAVLTAVAQPSVALVNNAQREHQEFMQTVQAVAEENGAVLLGLPADGLAVYPGDDTYTALWNGLSPACRRLRFGFADAAAEAKALEVTADGVAQAEAGVDFVLHLPSGSAPVALSIPGVHNVRNAMAAAACTHAVGVPLQVIAQGLAAFRPVGGRLQSHAWRGMRLIDDTYNANPDSVRAAIDVLAQLGGERVLVLGDMGEVGLDGDAAHAEVGAYARDCGIQALLALGTASHHAVMAFGQGARGFDSVEALVDEVMHRGPSNVLVKGSRFMRMERVVKQLQAHGAQQEQKED